MMQHWAWLVAIALAAVATFCDWRKGAIPNWLTLPPLVVAPLFYGLSYGPTVAAYSVLSAAACGLVPYLLYRCRAAGGGDVKLLASIGAVVGLDLGIEAEMIAFFAALLYAAGRMAWRGRLLATVANATQVLLRPLLPRSRRQELAPEMFTSVRLGGCVLVGTVLAVLARAPFST